MCLSDRLCVCVCVHKETTLVPDLVKAERSFIHSYMNMLF